VAQAGMKAEMQGRGSGKVRDFALYGETTGETDEFGLPVRYNWAGEYRGQAMVVYGHTPVPEPDWLNRTVNIDTGCVFGGKLTAERFGVLGGEIGIVYTRTGRRLFNEPALEAQFVAAYRRYCWPVASLVDLKLAPFHLLASEGRVHTDKSHSWHMDTLAKACREGPDLLLATSSKVVDVTDPSQVAEGVAWWAGL